MTAKRSKKIPRYVTESANKSKVSKEYTNRLKAAMSGECSFSFKYLQEDGTFIVNHQDATYYHKIIERLNELSKKSTLELTSSRSPALRCHPIDWSDPGVTRNCFGIPKEEELCETPYQISISSNAHGRIHGFFTGDIFNIVWFDKDHMLYSSNKK